MSDESDNLYAQREQRPSLADEIEQASHTQLSPLGVNVRKKIRAMRRRQLWIHRLALGGAVVYALGLTAFILVLNFRRPAAGTPPPISVPAVKSALVIASRPASDVRVAIQKWKDDAERLQTARVWIQKGRLDAAHDLLQAALDDNPENVEVLFELAQVTFDQGANERARELLQRVLWANPNHKTAPQMLATVYSRLGQDEPALALAQWVLEADPDSAGAHRIAGIAQLKAHRFDQAAIHFHKWAALEPDNPVALKQYADVLMELKEYDKAASFFEKILLKKNDEADAYRQLAICYAKQLQVNKAVETMTQAMSILGSSKVAAWFKDPGFDSIRAQNLFALLEHEITRPNLAGTPTHANETVIDMNTVFDQKHLQQIQDSLKTQQKK